MSIIRRRKPTAPGALDALAAPAACYSLDRRLLSSYTGGPVECTESGTSVKRQLTFGSNGRFSRSRLIEYHAAGNDALVDTINDQSGNGRHILYNTGTKLQLVSAGGWNSLNGRLMARATANGPSYFTNTFTAYTGTTMSGYFVMVPMMTATDERIGLSFVKDLLADYNLTTSMTINRFTTTVGTFLTRNGGNGQGCDITAGTPHVFTFRCDGSTGSIYIVDNLNGFQSLPITSAFDINRFILWGASTTATGANAGQSFLEAVVWFSDIGAAPLAEAANSAATYYGTWGTTASRPSSDFSVPDTCYVRPTSTVRYVSPTGTNSGTAATVGSPWATLNYAITNATAGDTVIFRQGTYREAVTGSTSKNLTLQAYPHEQVWFSGADVITGWVADSGRWRKDSWPKLYLDPNNANAPVGSTINSLTLDGTGAHPMAGWPDQIWIDDVPLTQVATLGACVAGTFFIDYATTKGYIGSDPTGKTVEAAVRPSCFNLEGGSGFTLKGIGIKRYASHHVQPYTAALRVNEANVVVEKCAIIENSYDGYGSFGADGILRETKLMYNGKNGAGAYQAHRLLMERNRVSFNNLLYFEPFWDAAGVKIVTTNNAIVRDNFFDDNWSTGVWLDITCANTLIVRNHIRRNVCTGITVEQCYRTYIVSNWISDGVLDYPGGAVAGDGGMGIYLFDSNEGWCYNNTLVNNYIELNIADSTRSPSAGDIAIAGANAWIMSAFDVRNNVLVSKLSSAWPAMQTVSYASTLGNTFVSAGLDYQHYLLPTTPANPLIKHQTSTGAQTSYTTLAAFVSGTIHEDNGISGLASATPEFVTGLTTTNGFQLPAGVATALNSGMAQAIYAAAVPVPRGALHLGWGYNGTAPGGGGGGATQAQWNGEAMQWNSVDMEWS